MQALQTKFILSKKYKAGFFSLLFLCPLINAIGAINTALHTLLHCLPVIITAILRHQF
jgi:hypothetical protein